MDAECYVARDQGGPSMDRRTWLVRVPVLVCLACTVLPWRLEAQSIKISGGLAPQRTGTLLRHELTPDGARLVYLAARTGNGPTEHPGMPADRRAPRQPPND